jgi:50S ribosomal protein L16 3-hydroxylase
VRLGELTPRQFLARHWQKSPLLVRQAFPGFRDPVSPQDLASLACREDVESRLVLERGGARPWQVIPGPQEPERLRRLGRSHWTLLVQGVDAWREAVARLLEPFAFVPHWRVDDVMVSLAAPRGTVGPHVDSYDVFLLQGRGQRRWQISRRFSKHTRPGLDLQVLARFRAEQEWVLEPGDMLYLPPGVAHYGVALEECLTYSIGFRAPSPVDLLVGTLRQALATADRSRLYADPDLRLQEDRGEITRHALERLRCMVQEDCDRLLAPAAFAQAAGALLTETKDGAPSTPRRRVSATKVAAALRAGAVLARREPGRAAFTRGPGGTATLFVNGSSYPLPRSLAAAGPLLTETRRISAAALAHVVDHAGLHRLLAELVSAGAFRLLRGAATRGRAGSRRGTGSRSRAARR